MSPMSPKTGTASFPIFLSHRNYPTCVPLVFPRSPALEPLYHACLCGFWSLPDGGSSNGGGCHSSCILVSYLNGSTRGSSTRNLYPTVPTSSLRLVIRCSYLMDFAVRCKIFTTKINTKIYPRQEYSVNVFGGCVLAWSKVTPSKIISKYANALDLYSEIEASEY